MWKCSQCGETGEDAFDACWKCGAARDGTPDPMFQHAVARSSHGSDLVEDDKETPAETMAPPVTLGPGMNRHEIATLVCKTIALLMFALAAFGCINALVLVAVLACTAPIHGRFQWHEFSVTLVLAVPSIAALLVGFVFWKYSSAMAKGMVAADPTPVTSLSLNIQDAMAVAFSTTGVFMIVNGVREVIQIAAILYQYEVTVADFWLSTDTWTALVQLGVGFWLLVGSRGIANLLYRIRTAGDYSLESPATNEADAS